MKTALYRKNLSQVMHINKELRSEGMTWKEINQFWKRCLKVAKVMPYESPVARKYQERKTLAEVKKVLGNRKKQPLNVD